MTTGFLLAGVGGQGIILASEILTDVGAAAGYDVKKSEIHGMSQRGGSVDSHVRWGEKVFSPVAPRGSVNYMLSFEMMEGARHLDYLAPDGIVVVNAQKVPTLATATGAASYPTDDELVGLYGSRASRVVKLDALDMARSLGKPAVVSTVMLGALSALMSLDESTWLKVIGERVPARLVDVNVEAFRAGRRLVDANA